MARRLFVGTLSKETQQEEVMEEKEIKKEETQETTEEEIEGEEVDVTKLSDDELKAKSKELKEGAGKKEEKKTRPKVETKVEETSTKKEGEKTTETKTEVSAEELPKLKKQVQDKEDFIQKQAREIGELRKSIRDIQTKTGGEKIDTSAGTEKDPILSFEKRKVAIKEAIPNLEEITQDIVDLVRKEGHETEENIALFLNNPYMADPVLLQEWANKVMRVKVTTELESLKKDKETLTKENEDLKKQLHTTGKAVIKNIEKAAQTTKTLTAKTGAEEEESVGITEDQIPYLSDEQLKELRKKVARR